MRAIITLAILATLTPLAGAMQPAETLRVATREVPPFAIKADDGSWRGLSVWLWNRVSEKLGAETSYVDVSLDEMLDGVASGEFDAAVAALTITADREARLDFSHPYFQTGLGIATPVEARRGWWSVLRRALSLEFLEAVATLMVVLFIVGALLWAVERRQNKDQFGGGTARGLGSGLWWSAVTMTTVGYGDKAPVTFMGRFIGLIWMFTSIVVISGMTAAIASALTVSQLETAIDGPEDLPGARIATVRDSTSAAYLQDHRLSARQVASLEVALKMLAAGEVEAVVYDAAVLKYELNKGEHPRLRMAPYEFNAQGYGFALGQNSRLREAVNQAILETLETDEWNAALATYLGQ